MVAKFVFLLNFHILARRTIVWIISFWLPIVMTKAMIPHHNKRTGLFVDSRYM